MKHLLLMFVLLAGWIAPVAAETLVLKNGMEVQGRILMKSKGLVLLETPERQRKEIDMADIQEIRRGGEVMPAGNAKATVAPTAPAAAAAKPAPSSAVVSSGGAGALAKLMEELPPIIMYMSREPLAAWPDPEPQEKVQQTDPTGKGWKVFRKSGALEFLASPPAPDDNAVKVWCVCRSAVIIQETIVGLGTVDRTPAAVWCRMYWHTSTRDWGMSHPNDLAFRHRQDYARAAFEAMGRAADPQSARRLQDLWYELLNSGAGSAKDPVKVAAANQTRMAEMDQLAAAVGKTLGIGDRLARGLSLAALVEPRITPGVATAQKIECAKEQAKLLEEIVQIVKAAP